MPRLILASGSPRRCQLLEEHGFRFDVVRPRDEAESGVSPEVGPAKYVEELARRKGMDVVLRLAKTSNREHSVILSADTVAECGGEILGKPADADHARRMLSQLSDTEHRVYTGICLTVVGDRKTKPGGPPPIESQVVISTLRMDLLTDSWLDDFIASGKWQGKAGAFGLQDGIGVVQVTDGSETNVVGLPMEVVVPALGRLGCEPVSG